MDAWQLDSWEAYRDVASEQGEVRIVSSKEMAEAVLKLYDRAELPDGDAVEKARQMLTPRSPQ